MSTAGEQFKETQAFIDLVRQQWTQKGLNNLEAVELGLRTALLKDGRALLEKLVQSVAETVPDAQAQEGEKSMPTDLVAWKRSSDQSI